MPSAAGTIEGTPREGDRADQRPGQEEEQRARQHRLSLPRGPAGRGGGWAAHDDAAIAREAGRAVVLDGQDHVRDARRDQRGDRRARRLAGQRARGAAAPAVRPGLDGMSPSPAGGAAGSRRPRAPADRECRCRPPGRRTSGSVSAWPSGSRRAGGVERHRRADRASRSAAAPCPPRRSRRRAGCGSPARRSAIVQSIRAAKSCWNAVAPAPDRGLVGRVRLAVDADHGVARAVAPG